MASCARRWTRLKLGLSSFAAVFAAAENRSPGESSNPRNEYFERWIPTAGCDSGAEDCDRRRFRSLFALVPWCQQGPASVVFAMGQPGQSSTDGKRGEFMLGTWVSTTVDEEFDTYMAALGYSYVQRQLALSVTPTLIISRDKNDFFTMSTETALKTTSYKFKLGEKFELEALDGQKVPSLCTLDGKTLKLVEDATPTRKASVTTRTFEGDKMTTIYKCGSVQSKRTYERTSK